MIEIRYETLRKISKACMTTTTACTHCFSNLFICISMDVNRSDSACWWLVVGFDTFHFFWLPLLETVHAGVRHPHTHQ